MKRPILPRQDIGPIAARTLNANAELTEALAGAGFGRGMSGNNVGGSQLIQNIHDCWGRIAFTSGGTIPAMTSPAGVFTPGSNTVTFYAFNGTSLVAQETDTCFNISATAVAASKWIITITIDGHHFVIVESC